MQEYANMQWIREYSIATVDFHANAISDIIISYKSLTFICVVAYAIARHWMMMVDQYGVKSSTICNLRTSTFSTHFTNHIRMWI